MSKDRAFFTEEYLKRETNEVWDLGSLIHLVDEWFKGTSTSKIGRPIGKTKNAVVGRARRLNLPGRPSPLKAGARPKAPPPTETLPPLPSEAEDICEAPTGSPRPVVRRLRPIAEPPQPKFQPPRRDCCWPIGEPGQPGFRFCEAKALLGKPYCEEHAQRAYKAPRDRREDVAA